MLRQLHITGLGVIRELDIEPARGLTVLTGETGAGKTMITVGVSLALGGRGSAQLVRSGERAAKIQARFDAPAGQKDRNDAHPSEDEAETGNHSNLSDLSACSDIHATTEIG